MRKKQEELMQVKGVLDKMFKNSELAEKMKDYELMQLWSDFAKEHAGETIAHNTYAHRISDDRKLILGVKSAVLANELQFQKPKLEAGFIEFASKKGREIKALVFELR